MRFTKDWYLYLLIQGLTNNERAKQVQSIDGTLSDSEEASIRLPCLVMAYGWLESPPLDRVEFKPHNSSPDER
jgi:hypothetical protein